jgi:hypothetical protein
MAATCRGLSDHGTVAPVNERRSGVGELHLRSQEAQGVELTSSNSLMRRWKFRPCLRSESQFRATVEASNLAKESCRDTFVQMSMTYFRCS